MKIVVSRRRSRYRLIQANKPEGAIAFARETYLAHLKSGPRSESA
jgi:hypothetical protein